MRDVLCGVCACTLSIRSQLRASGGKLSLASLVVLAPAPHSAVGADPQSMQMLLTRLCSQMEAPPQHGTHEMYWLRKGPGAIPG